MNLARCQIFIEINRNCNMTMTIPSVLLALAAQTVLL